MSYLHEMEHLTQRLNVLVAKISANDIFLTLASKSGDLSLSRLKTKTKNY